MKIGPPDNIGQVFCLHRLVQLCYHIISIPGLNYVTTQTLGVLLIRRSTSVAIQCSCKLFGGTKFDIIFQLVLYIQDYKLGAETVWMI